MSKTNLNFFVSKVPAGALIDYFGGVLPPGFLLADGSYVSITAQPLLFSVIGYTYGSSNGGAQFRLPDVTETVVAGVDTTNTVLPGANALNASVGTDRVTLDETATPLHTHTDEVAAYSESSQAPHNHSVTYTAVGFFTQYTTYIWSYNSANAFRTPNTITNYADAPHGHGSGTSSANAGDQAHSNVQRVVVCNAIISCG